MNPILLTMRESNLDTLDELLLHALKNIIYSDRAGKMSDYGLPVWMRIVIEACPIAPPARWVRRIR